MESAAKDEISRPKGGSGASLSAWLRARSVYELFLCAVLALGVLFSLTALIAGLNQGVFDIHDFRQSQTGLTTQWLVRGGPWIGYETPIAGYPWKIPFEFPLYQWVCALVNLVGVPMNAAHRIVNWAFYAGAIVAGGLTIRRLGAAIDLVLTFAILMLFSPLYAFWSRTLMLESTALFCGALFLFGLVRYLDDKRPLSLALMVGGAVLGALVKITTFFAFGLGGGLIVLLEMIKLYRRDGAAWPALRIAIAPALTMAATLAVLTVWLHYSDALKQQNPFGAMLTAASLGAWNFGTLDQKLDPKNWADIFLGRTLTDTLGNPIVFYVAGALVLALRRPLTWAAPALALYAATFLAFTNLHVVHNYYQYADAAFCLLMIAAAIHGVAAIGTRWRYAPAIAGALLLCVVGLQAKEFAKQFWPAIVADQSANRAVAISQRLAERTRIEDVAFVFGYDWSSVIAYTSSRRAITLPAWSADAVVAHQDPKIWTGGLPIDAVVDCDQDPKSAMRPFITKVSAGLKPYLLNDCVIYDRVGPTNGEVAFMQVEAVPFRTDADLKPLSLDALKASATGAGMQFLDLAPEAGPSGAVPGIFAHIPTTLTAPIPAKAKEIVADFGMRPGAWSAGGQTKGACFFIDAVKRDGAANEVWTRCLRPKTQMADRNMQEVSVAIPAGTTALKLRTDAVPEGDSSWGWSYWANPRIR